jgi:hypothetical protein
MSIRSSLFALGLASGLLLAAAPGTASAHCDTLDGPVVQDARAALDSGALDPVLKWVRADDEAEIRAAFERTLAVRSGDEQARDLADQWFFETLVRVHRAGEGAPYTGLKSAGDGVPHAVMLADAALESGDVAVLADKVSGAVKQQIEARFERAHAALAHADHNVDAGREYVEAYVDYVHFVEGLHGLVSGGHDHHNSQPGPQAEHAEHAH